MQLQGQLLDSEEIVEQAITMQVNEAFARVERGEDNIYSSQEVEAIMAANKAAYFDH